MQDRAPCNTAQWLQDSEVKYIRDWLGNSLDPNPIENLWMIMKLSLRQPVTPQAEGCHPGSVGFSFTRSTLKKNLPIPEL